MLDLANYLFASNVERGQTHVMSLGFELRRKHHAIGEFSASLQLFQPISSSAFADVIATLKLVASDHSLPAAMPIQVLQFAAQNVPSGLAAMGPPTGVGYQRFSPNGEIAASLLCDGDEIIFTLREYSSWDELLPVISDIFTRLLTEYVKEVPAIKSIKLQYTNEFIASSDIPPNPSEIIREGSPWVAPFVKDAGEFWHCHSGRFVPVNDIQRNLININLDVTDAMHISHEKRRYVKLLILAGCFFNIHEKPPLVIEQGSIKDTVDRYFDEAHDLEKDVLRQMVSDPYLEAMGAIDA